MTRIMRQRPATGPNGVEGYFNFRFSGVKFCRTGGEGPEGPGLGSPGAARTEPSVRRQRSLSQRPCTHLGTRTRRVDRKGSTEAAHRIGPRRQPRGEGKVALGHDPSAPKPVPGAKVGALEFLEVSRAQRGKGLSRKPGQEHTTPTGGLTAGAGHSAAWDSPLRKGGSAVAAADPWRPPCLRGPPGPGCPHPPALGPLPAAHGLRPGPVGQDYPVLPPPGRGRGHT